MRRICTSGTKHAARNNCMNGSNTAWHAVLLLLVAEEHGVRGLSPSWSALQNSLWAVVCRFGNSDTIPFCLSTNQERDPNSPQASGSTPKTHCPEG